MPRQTTIKFLRTTKANLDAQKAISNLIVGEPYFITDTKQFAIADTVNTYILYDIPTTLSELTDDATHRLVTDTEKSTWNGKANASDVYTKSEIDSKIGDIETLLEAI